MEISDKGYNAFVVKYRVGNGGAPATEDLAAAVSYIFRNAESLGVGTAELLSVGQLGWREDGGSYRFTRGSEFRRRQSSKALDRRDGLHRAFGLFVE